MKNIQVWLEETGDPIVSITEYDDGEYRGFVKEGYTVGIDSKEISVEEFGEEPKKATEVASE